VDCQVPAHPAVLAVRLASRGKRSVKQVITWHEAWGDHWITEYGLAGRVGRFVERLVARTPARHLSVSSSTEAELASIGTVSGRVVEAGVDLTAIDVIVPRPEADVLHVGRLVPSKNVSLLLHSIAALVTEGLSPRVVIVGDGPDRPHLESLVSKLDLDHLVDFRGAMDRWENVIALIKGARVLALPSLREGFGLVALEAAACGTPVVTVDHHRNAARDLMVAGETGFVVPPTSGEFADALRQVLQDDDLREKLGRTARERVVSGQWGDVAEATLAVYGKVPA
jgi:glycosyltransferase involved in cell wall biosynthesis